MILLMRDATSNKNIFAHRSYAINPRVHISLESIQHLRQCACHAGLRYSTPQLACSDFPITVPKFDAQLAFRHHENLIGFSVLVSD